MEAAEMDDSRAKEYLMLELESEAKIRAVKHIRGLLRKPDQIEKVSYYHFMSVRVKYFCDEVARVDCEDEKTEGQCGCHVEHGHHTTTGGGQERHLELT